MYQMLKMRTEDFKMLLNLPKEDNRLTPKERVALENLCDFIPEDWETSKIVWFNENLEHGEVWLSWTTEILQEFSIPYELFYDGELDADDYWEFYNPKINEEPLTANFAKDTMGYLFKQWNFNELKHLPPVEFKEAVAQFFENPFFAYPALDAEDLD